MSNIWISFHVYEWVTGVKGVTSNETFYSFIEECLLPQLLPVNGNNPHSVVIMDNCSIHHIGEIVQMIGEVGAIVHFLPPYSPDFMSIEMAFSKVKISLKTNATDGDCIIRSFRYYYTTILPRLDIRKWIVLLITSLSIYI